MTARNFSIITKSGIKLLLLFVLAGSNSIAQEYLYVNAKTLNVRDTPGTAGDVIGKLNYGDKVYVIEQYNDSWNKINFRNREGYVCKKYYPQSRHLQKRKYRSRQYSSATVPGHMPTTGTNAGD